MKFYPQYSDDYIRLTGIIAIEGAHIDLLLSVACARANGRTESRNQGKDFRSETRDKVEQILKSESAPKSLKDCLVDWKSIADDRNYAIHGFTAFSDFSLSSKKTSHALRGPYSTEPILRNEEWLKVLTERMFKIADALSVYLDDIV